MDTRTSLTCRRPGVREPAAPGQLIQNALARAIEGTTLLIVIILVVRFSPVGFVWWQPFSLPSFFFFLQTGSLYTYLVCLVPLLFHLSCLFAIVQSSSVCLRLWIT